MIYQQGAIAESFEHAASAAVARELDAACRDRQADFIDAPVSGGQQGAENGQLSIMCGGDDSAYQRAVPVPVSYTHLTLPTILLV